MDDRPVGCYPRPRTISIGVGLMTWAGQVLISHLWVTMEHGHASRSRSASPHLPGPSCRRILSDSEDERDADNASSSRLQPAAYKRRRILSDSEDDIDSSDWTSESGSDENSETSGNSSVCSTPTRAHQRTPPLVLTGGQQSQWSDGRGFVPASYSFEGTNAGITSACDISEESPYLD